MNVIHLTFETVEGDIQICFERRITFSLIKNAYLKRLFNKH